MKTNSTLLNTLPQRSDISVPAILKAAFILIILFACFNANAQVPPSSNMSGPIKAFTTDTSLVFTCKVASISGPTISYTLVNNNTTASVVSQGNIQYNQAEGVFTQTVVVNPGNSKGSFTVYAASKNTDGDCLSSMSVTVITP